MTVLNAFKSLTLRTAVWVALASVGVAHAQSDSEPEGGALPQGYELSGDTRQCLMATQIDTIDPITEAAWLVTAQGGKVYLNRPQGMCASATRHFTYMQYNIHGGQLCRGEIVRILDQVSHAIQGSCSLGVFEELRPIEPTGE